MRQIMIRNRDFSVIQQLKIFASLSPVECRLLPSGVGHFYQTIRKGEMLFDEGDPINYLGILLKGECACIRFYKEGTMHMIQLLLPRDIIGLEVIGTSGRESPMRINCTKSAEILWLAYDELVDPRYVEQHVIIQLQKNIIHILATENMRRLYKIEFLSQKTLREKILAYLNYMTVKHKSNEFNIEMNREELAQFLSVNRSVLSSQLNLMKKEGLIDFKKNHFVIMDQQRTF
jgi:CRP-like cAMP-binding protein